MSPKVQTALKIILPLLVIALAVGGAITLVKSRPAPQRTEKAVAGTLVTIAEATRERKRIDVELSGVVQPARSVTLQPQVTGNVTWMSEKLVTGGVVQEGEILVKIEATDYRILLEQRETAVAQAEANLRLEEGQQRIAKREWELFKDDVQGENDPSLALREPQRRIAEVGVAAAKANLQKAKIDLNRTVIRAPFNAYIQAESVEIGQRVGPGVVMAQLVGTDEFWVQASVPMDMVSFIGVPGINAEGPGSKVEIVQNAGGEKIVRNGRVLRMLGDLDPIGRMARVIVEIDDPFGLKSENAGLPILIGAFVRGNVEGRLEREVTVLPRKVVHDGDKVWVFSGDETLEIRPVTVAWANDDVAYVSTGIEPGDRYVTSRLSTPLGGMKLRIEGGGDE